LAIPGRSDFDLGGITNVVKRSRGQKTMRSSKIWQGQSIENAGNAFRGTCTFISTSKGTGKERKRTVSISDVKRARVLNLPEGGPNGRRSGECRGTKRDGR